MEHPGTYSKSGILPPSGEVFDKDSVFWKFSGPEAESARALFDGMSPLMLAVQRGAFLGCNGWDDSNFGKPLGDPIGPAQVAADGTMWRNFSSGTSVEWNPGAAQGKKSRIFWTGDAPAPAPTPVPTPVPPQPTASCPRIYTACGWQHNNLATCVASSWMECCDKCRARQGCAKWVFRTGGQCVLHGANATHHDSSDDDKVCGTTKPLLS